MTTAKFVFITCQVGTESICKEWFLRANDRARFAFSRPGCLTFKLIEPRSDLFESIDRIPFVRACGWSLGSFKNDDVDELVRLTWDAAEGIRPSQLHVWERDRTKPNQRTFQSPYSPLARSAAAKISGARPTELKTESMRINRKAPPGACVLDCILLEPNEWLIGHHTVRTDSSAWAAGFPPITIPESTPSRAYMKMMEAIAWSKIPLRRDDLFVEIGSAPGGSCKALLERGQRVVGVDPAEMDKEVLDHPKFVHWRMRGAEVKRRALSEVRWLGIDANIVAEKAVSLVESLVTNENTHFQGLLLTLKFGNWQHVDDLPDILERIRGWGFRLVKARHLHSNRREVCVFALRQKALIRVARGAKKKAAKKKAAKTRRKSTK